MPHQVVTSKGRRFVMVPEAEWRQLNRLASNAETSGETLPAFPPADAEGNVPALAFIRVSIARDILQDRKALGLTQERLAELAGIRQETLSRLESGKHSPTVRTVEKIERALDGERKRLARRKGK